MTAASPPLRIDAHQHVWDRARVSYPWLRGDLIFTPDGMRLAYLAAAPDDRFQDAGEIPADPANPSLGGRLVFDNAPVSFATPPDVPSRPVKLLIVEEQIRVE